MEAEFDVRLITAMMIAIAFLSPFHAMAYVGPGIGAGTIGVILGIIGSLLVALFAVLWYPIKRLLKKIKMSNSQDTTL
jgi:hypothetical protein